MENLTIYVSQSKDCFAFALLPSQRKVLKSFFGEDAHPAKSILVNYDLRNGLVEFYSPLEKYILPALLGLENIDDLKKIKNYSFVDSHTQNIIDNIKYD